MKAHDRLDKIFSCPELVIECPKKAVFFSNLHEGDGGPADDFQPAKFLFLNVSQQYKDSGFTRFFLGDTWDRWQFPKIGPKNTCVEGEYFLKGNHDNDLDLLESVILKTGEYSILLNHGNPGDWFNDKGWRVGRFFTRIWKYFELVGFKEKWFSPSKSMKKHELVRKWLVEWANSRKVVSIFGHIHTQENEGYYWNTGSKFSEGKVDCIEYQNGKLFLKTWT
jgi:hypothetical protein